MKKRIRQGALFHCPVVIPYREALCILAGEVPGENEIKSDD